MELILSAICYVLAFFLSVLGNILAHDICVSADRTCTTIIRSAARRLAPFERESGESEWLAHLHDCETVREKYRHAIGCFLVAGKMRRQAQTIVIAMSFQITGVGTVPLTLKLNSRVLTPVLSKTIKLKPHWIKKTVAITACLYVLLKFVRSAYSSLPAGHKITAEHLKQYKEWGYGARLKRKGLDVDLGTIFRTMVLQPHRIGELLQKVGECFTPQKGQLPPAN